MSENLTPDADVPDGTTIDLATDIVSAYVGHNTISAAELPALIESVNAALVGMGNVEPEVLTQEPAVSIRTSVKPDSIACLECGKMFRTLKRHIRTKHDLTEDDYRAKWSLAADYPMIAPEFTKQRQNFAKTSGFGRKRRTG